MKKIKFTKKGFQTLAKEFRRAAWMASGVVASYGIFTGAVSNILAAAAVWVLLEALAFIVDSIS
jgi:hypothetical protein